MTRASRFEGTIGTHARRLRGRGSTNRRIPAPTPPTWWSCCSTTPASRSSAATAPTSTRRTSTRSQPTACSSPTSTSRRCARRPAPRCSPADRSTPSACGRCRTSAPASPTCSATSRNHAATVAEVLREEGYATFCVGKWHLAPMEQCSAAGPFDQWPLARGFDRFYGFLEGETDQFHPELVCDNHPIEPPAKPEDGYHLSEDLIDQLARDGVATPRASDPTARSSRTSPFGATHAPHQAPAELHGEVPGQVRRGLGRRPAALVRTPARARASSPRAPSSRRATPASTRGTTCPRTSGGSPAASRRRSPRSSTTPTTRSDGSSTACATWASSTTPCSSCSPTTAPRQEGGPVRRACTR